MTLNQCVREELNCRIETDQGRLLLPHTGQGRILNVGRDAAGFYYDLQLDAGYPRDADFKSSAIMVGNTPHFKPGTEDLGAQRVQPLGSLGQERIYWNGLKDNAWNVVPGDYVVCRGPGAMMLHADHCAHCTFQDITLYWSGVFAYFDTGGGVANRFLHDTLTYGPAPPGATNRPLLSESADAFHSPGAVVGPDIEGCLSKTSTSPTSRCDGRRMCSFGAIVSCAPITCRVRSAMSGRTTA